MSKIADRYRVVDEYGRRVAQGLTQSHAIRAAERYIKRNGIMYYVVSNQTGRAISYVYRSS